MPLIRPRPPRLMIIALASVSFALTFGTQAATLRCGSQLVSTGDHLFEVERKCGTPASQAIVGTQETFNNTYRKSEQVQIEEWIYGPDHGMYQYLRFIGGRLTEITSKRGN